MSGEHLCCFANSQSQPSLGVCGWGGIRGWGEICPVVFTRTITQLCTQWNKHSSNATTDVERKNECEETKNEADENTSIRSTHSWQQKKLLWLLRQLYSTFPESLLSLHHCLFGFFLSFFQGTLIKVRHWAAPSKKVDIQVTCSWTLKQKNFIGFPSCSGKFKLPGWHWPNGFHDDQITGERCCLSSETFNHRSLMLQSAKALCGLRGNPEQKMT